MATDGMDIDMDIDLTVDDPEIARLQAEAAAFGAKKDAPEFEVMNGVEEPIEEGEVDANEIVPKVHVRGVDSFRPRDVENYANDYYPTDLFKKVEWIDDTSLNLVYDTELAAAEALQAFSEHDAIDPLELRPAKRLATHPDVEIFVRRAVASDVKVKGAAQYSRFYLDHPEYDPETRKRTHSQRGGHRGYRERDYGHKRPRREYEDNRYSRRSSTEKGIYDESMYDDDVTHSAKRPESRSSGSDYARRTVKFDGDDLFADKQSQRLRDRSASPTRDGDGRYGFRDDQSRRRTARARSPTPPHIRQSRANHTARDAVRKELFPDRRLSHTSNVRALDRESSIDRFSKHASPMTEPKELLPNHRRQGAKDMGPEEVTEAIGLYHLYDGANDVHAYNHSGRRPDNSERRQRGGGDEGRDLFSRISGGPKVESAYGRLQDTPSTNNGGFKIKGTGKAMEPEFNFRGASKEQGEYSLVKELFPQKIGGGAKKDLFDGRIKGRGQRKRAEDLD